MTAAWAYYDTEGERVSPRSARAKFMGREVRVDSGAPPPAGHASLGAVHYVDVHAIGAAERQKFTSAAKFKAWCRAQTTRPPGA